MTRISHAVAAVVLLASIAAGSPAAPADAAASPTQPTRVLDTRIGIGGSGPVLPGRTVEIPIPSVAAAEGATAIALNVTATDAASGGYVTVWPCHQAKPATSNLNHAPGRSVPNMAVVQADGAICLESSSPVQLIVDLMGWFTGRNDVAATAPQRIVDTRLSGDEMRAGEVRRVRVGGTPGLPAGSRAAMLNVTVTGPSAGGYLSVYPCPAAGSAVPNTSTLNFQGGDTVAAFTLAALSGDHVYVCIYSSAQTQLIVDTFGWSPGTGDLRGLTPARVLDTRNGIWSTGAAQNGQTVKVRVAGRGGVPNTAHAGLFTLTVTDVSAAGYVTAWPCDAAKPNASVLNFWPGATRANAAMLELSQDSGEICLSVYTSNGTPVSLIADAVGFVPGSVDRPPVPAPPTSPSPPPAPSGPSSTLPVGAALPSGADCAARVRPAPEVRPENAAANNNRGSAAIANTRTDWAGFQRVDGNFAGTTDEIIQWAACKWGIDENIARAQVIKESYWYQSTNGDNGESWGLGQVRDTAHQSAFQFGVNARTSSAYNLDYTYASWRACYEGAYTWLNTVERNGVYAAGDVWGCLGVWFSGRWYVNNDAYLNQEGDSVRWHYDNKTWRTPTFVNG